jgi:hypothetical protein
MGGKYRRAAACGNTVVSPDCEDLEEVVHLIQHQSGVTFCP